MSKLIAKIKILFLIFVILTSQLSPAIAVADDTTPSPSPEVTQSVTGTTPANPSPAQAAPDQPQPTQTQSTPAPTNPEVTVSPTLTPTPTLTPQQQAEANRQATIKSEEQKFIANYCANNICPTGVVTQPASSQTVNANQTGTTATPTPTPTPAGVTSNGNTGDTIVATGNAINNGTSTTIANDNLTANGPAIVGGSSTPVLSDPQGASVINNGNGAGSSNTSTSGSASNNNTNQTNSAIVSNNNNQSSNTGNNQSSLNNGNTIINTGNSNTSGTAITAVNTNADGVSVSEFNIVDDQKGDLVLTPEAFAANCISGCSKPASTANTGNGANSTNNANSTSTTNNNTFQTNDATVGNNMTLTANSGNNDASLNTGGNTTINTGDANIAANSLTFVNNNISGNVQFGVVNIYGTLDGNIILPDYTVYNPNPASAATAANTDNGTGSTNKSSVSAENNNNTFQNNDAAISNNILINAQTGDNSSGTNTNGNSTIKTGDTNVQANVVNIANTNVSSGQDMWLVFVFRAGQWVGQLLGAPAGSTYAGSAGTTISTDPQSGQISATNNGNGAGSNNNSSVGNSTNNAATQTNTANINNTLNLSANTGGNTENYNTGGNNIIRTGDANIIANLVNFANNNISGGGVLHVLFVNIFGKLNGDIAPPGQKPQAKSSGAATPANGQNTDSPAAGSTPTAAPAAVQDNSNESYLEKNTGIVAGAAATTINTVENIGNSVKTLITSGTTNKKIISYRSKKSNTKTKVAGISTSNNKLLADASFGYDTASPAKSKAININLAWGIIILPLIGVYFIGKYLLKKRLFIKK